MNHVTLLFSSVGSNSRWESVCIVVARSVLIFAKKKIMKKSGLEENSGNSPTFWKEH
jgi:hypothetical protein